jgi:hypothetical protein
MSNIHCDLTEISDYEQSKILRTLPDCVLMQAVALASQESPKESTIWSRGPRPSATNLAAAIAGSLEAKKASRTPLPLSVFISII